METGCIACFFQGGKEAFYGARIYANARGGLVTPAAAFVVLLLYVPVRVRVVSELQTEVRCVASINRKLFSQKILCPADTM